ncbi:coronin-7-like isoform X2 [Ornithodoros turicata]|uniref:coronin-7-like isoform X2 n=1 Tax=Ornithodoros turicata TaxID=34597 RepID=UPI003138D408
MYRFKSSKYKNATPKVPKKGEGWVLDLSIGAPQSFGNHIKASALFKAFSVDNRGGGSLGILPLDEIGKKSRNCPLLHAHADFITDFDFCPYDDGLLATCSYDSTVKIWRIPEEGVPANGVQNAEMVLQAGRSRVENVVFNPAVDCVLASATDRLLQLWDLVSQTAINSNNKHTEVVQSLSWKGDGSQVVSSGRDKKLRIWDPRVSTGGLEANGHSNNRDSRVVWLGNTDYIVSTGLGTAREREVSLRDVRKFNVQCASTTGESAMGVFIPLYDPDTNMLFLVAKGDITVNFWEVTFKEPFLNEASKYMGEVQTKGAGLVPKRALKVMDGEVNRVLLLGQDCIVPVSYQVPRKTYRDFHADIFPDTQPASPTITVSDWLEKKSARVISKVSLDPEKRPKEGLVRLNHKLGSGVVGGMSIKDERVLKEINVANSEACIRSLDDEKSKQVVSEKGDRPEKLEKPLIAPKPAPRTRVSSKSEDSSGNAPSSQNGTTTESVSFRAGQRSSIVSSSSVSSCGSPVAAPRGSAPVRRQPSRSEGRGFKVRVSKFRHLNGVVGSRDTQITNLPPLCKTIPGESEGFRANTDRLALPLAISGGHVAILELTKRGRLQSGVVPSLICGTSVMDFAWDPFDNNRIAIACDDGRVRIWTVPEGGLTESLTEPDFELKGHTEKVHFVKFHPTAADTLATGSHDLTVILWDLESRQEMIRLQGHTDQIFSLAWNPDGKTLATVCKDQRLRIYNPRQSEEPISEGPGPSGTRGARVTWVLGGTHLVTTGFNKVSERQVSLYEVRDISSPLTTEGIDVSPAILIPFYDEDSSTLFLTGKGDSTIFAFEVAADSPHFFPLSHYKCGCPHQAVSFLPKVACNIGEVEFAKAFRLTTTTVEPLSFKVPRLRSELFQDDLFPDTRVTWEPAMTSTEWFSGGCRQASLVSLRPSGMELLSEAPEVRPPAPHVPRMTLPDVNLEFEGDLTLSSSLIESNREKEEQIINSMKSRIANQDAALPQDTFEGVDPKEWDEDV